MSAPNLLSNNLISPFLSDNQRWHDASITRYGTMPQWPFCRCPLAVAMVTLALRAFMSASLSPTQVLSCLARRLDQTRWSERPRIWAAASPAPSGDVTVVQPRPGMQVCQKTSNTTGYIHDQWFVHKKSFLILIKHRFDKTGKQNA